MAVAMTSAHADDDVVVNAGKDGFSLQSRGGAFLIKFRGGVQADSGWFLNDRTKLNTDTFVGRRVRPIIEGTVHERYDFRVMFDLVDGRSTLLDAYLEVRPSDALKLRLGKYKPPVGLERLQSFSDMRFVERAYPTNLAPNRDYGFMVHGEPLKGAIELAARFQTFDVAAEAFENGAADPTKSVRRADTWTGGVNWYLNRNARFTVNYELTEFRRGAAQSKNRPTERVIETRCQLAW